MRRNKASGGQGAFSHCTIDCSLQATVQILDVGWWSQSKEEKDEMHQKRFTR